MSRRNHEYYADPTPWAAIGNIEREARRVNMTPEQVRAYYERRGKPVPADIALAISGAPPKRSKYGNVRTPYGGRMYDSRKEAARAAELDMLQRAGFINKWFPQVAFPLTDNTEYRADFVVLYPDMTYRVEDVKSDATRKDKVYRTKKRQIKDLYGFDIEEV